MAGGAVVKLAATFAMAVMMAVAGVMYWLMAAALLMERDWIMAAVSAFGAAFMTVVSLVCAHEAGRGE